MKVSNLAGNDKAVGKSRGNPELPLVFLCQLHAVPLAEGRRIPTNIHDHVKNTAE